MEGDLEAGKFHKKFPDVHIKIINATSIGCVELLESEKVDIIIVNLPNNHMGKSLTIKEIHRFKDVFVANDDYKELCDRQMTLKQLLEYPIMMLEHNSTTSEFLHLLFQKEGLEFVPDYCLTDVDLEELFVVETKKELPER